MPRNGFGVYSLSDTLTASTPARAEEVNAIFQDVADALSASLSADGQKSPTDNLPMNSKKHTGVANASARTEYASAGQVQDQGLVWGGTAGGTATALTCSLSPAITSYVAGQQIRVIAASDATGAATIAVNGLTAKTIKRNGEDIAAEDWFTDDVLDLVYDGTNFQLGSPFYPSTSIEILETVYPVGSIYVSTVATSPETLFGFGTWVAFGKSQMLVGAGTGSRALTLLTATASNDQLTVASTDGWYTGMAVVYAEGTAISGLSNGTYYLVIVDSTTIKLTTSIANAVKATPTVVNISADWSSGDGTLTHTYTARSAGAVGGEETHALSIAELPTFTGISSADGNQGGGGSAVRNALSIGSNMPHNNMPPYVVVYMWNRTA